MTKKSTTTQVEEDCGKAIGTEVRCSLIWSRRSSPVVMLAASICRSVSALAGSLQTREVVAGRVSQPSRAVEDRRNFAILFLGATRDLLDQGEPKPGMEADRRVQEAGLGRHA